MKLDIRVGTIVEAKKFDKAKKPAYQLQVDFGEELGIKKSSAQITQQYSAEELVLGTYSEGGVVLIIPDKEVKNGDKLG